MPLSSARCGTAVPLLGREGAVGCARHFSQICVGVSAEICLEFWVTALRCWSFQHKSLEKGVPDVMPEPSELPSVTVFFSLSGAGRERLGAFFCAYFYRLEIQLLPGCDPVITR